MKETPFVQYDSPLGKEVLYTPCKAVENILSKDFQDLLIKMKERMTGWGIGLAANQVGASLQAFMIEFTQDKSAPSHTNRYRTNLADVPFQVFINPKITRTSKEKMSFWHGCLSALEHKKGIVATYKWIDYEAYNEKGEKIKGRLDDFGSVIFQHEFRHLLGGLFLNKAKTFHSQEELWELFDKEKLKPYDKASTELPLLLEDYLVGESVEEYSQRRKHKLSS